MEPSNDLFDPEGWEYAQESATRFVQAGDLSQALNVYDEFIVRRPPNAEAHFKRATILNRLGLGDEAIDAYEKAIAIDPNHGRAYCNRGSVFLQLNKATEALRSYDMAISIDPEDYLALYNRANIYRLAGRLDDALIGYEKAIQINCHYAEAFVNRGNVLQEMSRHEAAVESYNRAIELKPILPAAYLGLGNSFYSMGKLDVAIANFDSALALDPKQKFLIGMRRHIQMQICDWHGLDDELLQLAAEIKGGMPVSPPHPVLALIDSPYIQRLAAEIWVRENYQTGMSAEPFAVKGAKSRIHVGYFSADFRDHPVSQLAIELFEKHDRSRFEITAIAFGPKSNDDMRARAEQAFDRFVDVREQSDDDVVSLVRRLGLDLAVDLGGHTEHCRTRLFVMRVAPVQINYLGFPGTMGAAFMDYLIADRTVVPLEQQTHYSEKIVHLPGCFLPSLSAPTGVSTTRSKPECGLPSDQFIFCCFNNSYKITPSVFDVWMRVMNRVEGSVLWLAQHNSLASGHLRAEAARRGVAPERLIFAGRTKTSAEHRARLALADLVLDTYPYNAHASALDALRAGVPVVTRIGRAFASRVAASLLSTLDLNELIVTTPLQFEELCVRLAASPEVLRIIRKKLALNFASYSLRHSQNYVEKLEQAYACIYDRFEAGLLPDHIWL